MRRVTSMEEDIAWQQTALGRLPGPLRAHIGLIGRANAIAI